MSTNDDSASRRGRRPEQGERRGPGRQDRDERWDQSSSHDRAATDPYLEQRGRDNQSQRGTYSNFSRHAYSPPPPPRDPAPQPPQSYRQEPVQRNDPPRYVEPGAPSFSPPPPAFEPEPPHLNYNDAGRDDLFARDPGPLGYDQNPYAGPQGGYQADPYDQNRGHQPMTQPATTRRDDPQFYSRDAQSPIDDYERSFSARIAQETQASRFFLPEDQPQQPRAVQPDRGYAPPPPPQYAASPYPPQDYGAHYPAQDAWADEHALPEDDRAGHPQHDSHGDELDEDFFADEDELEHEHLPAPKRGRKKLIVAALAGAIAVGGGGAYIYKSIKGGSGESATPYIRADNRPLKEFPGNPGGKQFPNGEKTIYDRLTPDGQQVQVASLAPSTPASQAYAPPAAGNSLEERIDEALRKAQRTGDAPQPAPQGSRSGDQPTVVRSESYRPDGTRVDGSRPTVTPSIVDVNGGQLPPPFGNGTQGVLVPQPAGAPPFRTAPVPSASAPQFAAAAPTPAPVLRSVPPATRTASLTPVEAAAPAGGSGFWVSLKSAPDEKAIQRDLPMLTTKYKSVLGDVQLSSKIADLGAKGVTYRAVAGPLGSRQEAMDLCQKIKGAGGSCFVTN